MTNYLNGEIHEWTGGECPVPPNTRVHIWLRDVSAEESWHDSQQRAGDCSWQHGDEEWEHAEIVRFQVILE